MRAVTARRPASEGARPAVRSHVLSERAPSRPHSFSASNRPTASAMAASSWSRTAMGLGDGVTVDGDVEFPDHFRQPLEHASNRT